MIMKIIFLDIDGVLNADCDFGGRSKPNPTIEGHCGICKTHVKHLKNIVDKTDAKIVLVSSWKRDYEDYIKHGYHNRIGKYLYNKLRAQGLQIVDTTLRYDFSYGSNRGYEISQWLEEHPEVDSWVVLDDEKFKDYDFLKITPHLVQTDYRYGLWALPELEAIYKLTGEKSELIDYLKNPLKYIDEAIPKAVEKTFEDLLVVHSLEDE